VEEDLFVGGAVGVGHFAVEEGGDFAAGVSCAALAEGEEGAPGAVFLFEAALLAAPPAEEGGEPFERCRRLHPEAAEAGEGAEEAAGRAPLRAEAEAGDFEGGFGVEGELGHGISFGG